MCSSFEELRQTFQQVRIIGERDRQKRKARNRELTPVIFDTGVRRHVN
jgi:hypothetical protein